MDFFNIYSEYLQIDNTINVEVLLDEKKLSTKKDFFLNSWQTVYTRDHVCKDLVNTINENMVINEKNRILVMFNVSIVKILLILGVKEKNIFYIADSQEKYDMVHDNFPNIHIVYLDENSWNIDSLNRKLKEFMMKKFDMVFSNPPYSVSGGGKSFKETNLDLMFLINMLEHADHVSFVMTARFLVRQDMEEYRKKLNKYVETVILFDGNTAFGTELPFPFCIVSLNKNKTTNKIVIKDEFIHETFEIDDLNKFSKYNFTEEEVKWWNEFLNTPLIDNYNEHEEGWYEFNAAMGLYLNSASSYKGTVVDVVTEQAHIFTDKHQITKRTKKMKKELNFNWHIVPINNKQEGEDIIKSYECEIIRAIIDATKNNHRICAKTTKMLPWPVDENGNIKQFTNEDWIKKLNIPESIAKKILKYYSTHREMDIV